MACHENGSRSQLSPLMWTFSPLPIRQVEPLRTRLLAFKMLCQAYDPFVLTPSSKIEQLVSSWGSIWLWILCRKGSQFQSCLPRRVRLNRSKYLKPRPPWFFGKHNLFQLTQWILRTSPLYPNQNFRIKNSISFHKPFGSLKQFMVKVGMAWITTSIRISLLAYDSSFSFHPCILCQIFSWMLENLDPSW